MSTTRPNLLLVDDEPLLVKALTRLLKTTFNVFPAHRGEEALEILYNHQIHVILSDQRMPEMSGVELLAQVRTLSPNTTRLLLTGYAELQDVSRAVNEGEIYRYLTKPWNNDELLRVTRQAADIAQQLFNTPFSPQPPQPRVAQEEQQVLVYSQQPQLRQDVQALCGRWIKISSEHTPEAALKQLECEKIQVLVADIGRAPAETLAFIKLAKSQYPQVLALIIADEADSRRLISLINEGQIYRYLTKPYSLGQLKLYLLSALRYQKKLSRHHLLLQRHQVEPIQDSQTRSLAKQLVGRLWRFLRNKPLTIQRPPC